MKSLIGDETISVTHYNDGIPEMIPIAEEIGGTIVDLVEVFYVDLSNGITIQKGDTLLVDETGNEVICVVYDYLNKEVVDVVTMIDTNNFSLKHKEVN